jgi:BMFP domain-containing protein YqiC
MSTDRTTEILNYLSAISREVGELRTEMNARFAEVNAHLSEQSARLDRIETEVARIGREQRLQGRTLDRIGSVVLTARADIDELQERVDTLEGKQA